MTQPAPNLATFVASLRDRLATVVNETEVRDRFCAEVYAHYGLTFRMERGHSDARLNRVILEFKDKGLFRGSVSSHKFIEAYSQLTERYIPQQAVAEGLPPHEYIGVAIDGEHYALVFFEENGGRRHTALVPIELAGIFPLIDALIRDRRRAFTVENLGEDFGAESPIARTVIHELWNHLAASLADASGSHKVRMLYEEWKKLFAQTTSLGRIGRARIDAYLLSIGLTTPLDHTKALFTLHTYNALLAKLLAGELLTTLRYQRYSGFASEAAGHSGESLRELLNRRIEHAEVFVANDIENFIEGTFFSWYIENTPNNLLEAIRQLLARLGLYVFPTVGQSRVRDVVKVLYQNLVPSALRKNIGEFYTPEWLVDFVLNEAGYTGSAVLGKKFLDPCCGSGNFLIHAIARYKQAGHDAGQAPERTVAAVLQSIVGFDLNPLAVISARLNYLLAIADILPRTGRLEIPIYLADAVYAPIREENGGSPTRSYKIGTVLEDIELVLPEALVQDREHFGLILSLMERDVEDQAGPGDFLAHLITQPTIRRFLEANPLWTSHLRQMYERVLALERRNWNRIWCRIVRNYFASVAVGRVDTIAGNPPWVRWSELPEDYRERIKPTCTQYDILSSRTPFFGGSELDISGMIAYTVTDKWLKDGGTLGFVITQIHFQAPSSEGFRGFRLPDRTPLRVPRVHDLTHVKPFPKLANKPAVFTWVRGAETSYPVPYTEWRPNGPAAIPEDAPLTEVLKRIHPTEKAAVAIPPDQRWSILAPEHLALVAKLQGGSAAWRGRKGITTDLNGAFFVELLGPGSGPGLVKVRTTPDSGNKPVPLIDHDVEARLVFPLLKGAGQIRPFQCETSMLGAIVPNTVITSIPAEATFRREYPAAHRYFRRINRVQDEEGRPLLEGRSTWKTRMKPNGAPFYAIYNVGVYTFAPYKVVWAEMAGDIAAAVASAGNLPHGIGTRPVVPDHKVYFVSTQSQDEAHFLCAMLNSEPVRVFVNSFTVKIQVGTIFRHLKLPSYDSTNPNHRELVRLSRQAHRSRDADTVKRRIDRHAWAVVRAS